MRHILDSKEGDGMPTVDFTLEDVRKVVNEEIVAERAVTKQTVENALVEERKVTKTSIQDALAAEREVTKRMLQDALVGEREVAQAMMTNTFLSFWESNLGPAFDELHGEFGKLRAQVHRAGKVLRN